MISDLEQREERYALAIEGTDSGLWDWDLLSNKVFYSDRWKSMLGYEDSESSIGNSPKEWLERLHPDDAEKFKVSIEQYLQGSDKHFKAEYRILHEQGYYLWILCRGRAVWDKAGKPLRFLGFQIDITERKNREQQLLHNAFHDSLTELSNRALFIDRLNQALHGRFSFAVLYMDLDRFKEINDTLGHKAGDELLMITARRLEMCSRAGDTIARLGGDEFAILLTDIFDSNEVENIAKRIIKEIALPMTIEGEELYQSITIGIALGSPLSYKRPEEVLQDADIALYQAKKKRKGGYQIFNEKMRQLASSYLRLEADLRRDIKKGKIIFYYQPIIDLKTEKIIGLEALLRWEHEHYGTLKPINFLALAEEAHLLVNLEKSALEIACKQFEKLQKYIQNIKFFITFNISDQQLREKDFIENINIILSYSKMIPALFHLEVSERMIINNMDHIENVFKLITGLGFKLSLDGFGTGYSSLAYIHRYPFSFLKIDPSYMKEATKNPKKINFIKNIIQVAKSLDIAVIAAGVESEDIAKMLQKLHCPYGQGFYYSKPLPIEEVIELLEKNSG